MTKKQLIIYGIHPVISALKNNNRRISQIITSKNHLPKIEELAKQKKVKIEISEDKEIDKIIPPTSLHQSIIAYADPLEDLYIEDILADSGVKKIALLDHITDPHNFGAIVRSAAAFGIDAIITTKDNAPREGGALLKSASGCYELVPIVRITNLVHAINLIKKAGFWVLGLDGKAKTNLSENKNFEKIALIFGSEGEGLRRLTEQNCDILVKLPIAKQVESLNVSNAAAIAFYELSNGEIK